MSEKKNTPLSPTGKDNPAVIDCEKLGCRELIIEGTSYKTHFTRKYENKKSWVLPDPGKISSFIPGTITSVFVKPGDLVKKGEDMLIFSAMKMQNRVKASHDLKVKKVHVKEGDKISKGFLMLEVKLTGD